MNNTMIKAGKSEICINVEKTIRYIYTYEL